MSTTLLIMVLVLFAVIGAVYINVLNDGEDVANLGDQLGTFIEKFNIPWPRRVTATPDPAVAVPTTPSLPASFTSGESRFSQGSCITAADCKVSGCSGEVCGRSEAITTCEFSDDFPNVQGLSCGCVRGKCGWAR